MTWTLILALLVKSSLIAGAGLLLAPLLSRRPADRVDVLRGAVCLLLALPLISALLPSLDLALLPPLPVPDAVPAPVWQAPALQAELGPIAGVAVTAPVPALSWPLAFAALWLAGAAVVAGRLALGLFTLDRWTRQGAAVRDAAWRAPLAHLKPRARPQLIASARVSGPLSWGADPGVILIDDASLAEREAAPAILAHELAHIRRRDWLFLVLSRLALALFWFNPLVWRLHEELAARSEEAADADAISSVDRHLYARALVRLAAHPAPHAATAMAANAKTLKKRIACIMTDKTPRRRPLTVAVAVAALAAVATPLAALEITRPEQAQRFAPFAATLTAPMAALRTVTTGLAESRPSPRVAEVSRKEALDLSQPRYDQSAGVDYEAYPGYPAYPAPPEMPAPSAYLVLPTPPTPPAPSEGRILYGARQDGAVQHRAATPEQAAAARRTRAEAAQARVEAEQARAEALQARREGELAREEGARAMAQGRIEMAEGAEEMRAGAAEMRREAVRLQDAAYRRQVIAENRARGQTVTDEELQALSRRLPAQAENLERGAAQLQARSEGRN